MPAIQICKAGPDEHPALLALLDEYYAAANVVLRDEPSAGDFWLAFCDGQPAGCIALRPLPQFDKAGEIKRLYVRPAHRGKGLARRLLAALETFASERRFNALYLDTTDDMRDAHQLYESCGYVPCDRYNQNPQATIFMCKTLQPLLTLREFESGDEAAFCQLNEAWIEKYFKLEDKDRQTLRQPQKYILSQGGQIFMALRGDVAVGCCALIPMPNGAVELSKMGVAETERGQGIGRRLLEHVIAEARTRGIHRLYLETNHKLENAIHLYRAVGFTDVPPERVTPSPYQRADVYMEMSLA